MARWSASRAGLLCVLVGAGCPPSPNPTGPEYRDLEPYPNPAPMVTDLFREQPHRDNPGALALTPDGRTLFVALQGSIDEPGQEVLALDASTLDVTRRYEVGSSPSALAVHPSGRFVVTANRFSNYLSLIDLGRDSVDRIEADFHAVDLAFASDGERLFVANRWRDTLQAFDVRHAGGWVLRRSDDQPSAYGAPVAINPGTFEVAPDSASVLVGGQGETFVTRHDAASLRELARVNVGAAVSDLAVVGDLVYVATLSASTHHPPDRGPDTDGDGRPGDDTANEGFQDLQNEIAVYRAHDLQPVVRYTSDSICCFDYRDVSPDDPTLGRYVPDRALWIVGGALPEQVATYEVDGRAFLLVVYSGSNEIQRFEVSSDGSLVPGPKLATGYNPSALAVDAAARRAYVANRLGESVMAIDLDPFEVVQTAVVGDVSGGLFPATDAEIGELYYFSGAAFSVDGDQTCNHCHRDRGNVGKAFSMPLLVDSRGSRMTPASRGMAQTRPWFFEGAMDENNFFPVINEFARAENFCCHGRDAACLSDVPDECAALTSPRRFPTRDAFFLETARQLIGRDESVGDALPTRLDYLGLTRLLGLFLLQEPALLPNPNPDDSVDAMRGRNVFQTAGAGCAVCHPQPAFTVSFEHNPSAGPLYCGPLVTPTRDDDGTNLDLTNPGFLGAFPMARQTDLDVLLTAPSLVGVWDRAPGFLHDGRARTLREALCTPNHPALGASETGHNVTDGVFDTHGGTSDLTPGEIEDLVAYLLSL